MAELDSWEDSVDDEQPAPPAAKPAAPKPGGFSFNPNASAFSFSPGASSFVPGGSVPAPAAPPMVDSVPVKPTTSVPAAEAPAVEPDPSQDIPAPVEAEQSVEVARPDAVEVPEQSAVKSAAAPEPKAVEKATEAVKNMSVDPKKSKEKPPLEALEDQRDHMNIVFIGHVDAGKSTIGGQILYLTGGVDERTIQKYEREAKDKNRESWYMAYIMDTNEEERAKGKTVECGRASFETEKKRYTILDAPGHKNYVPNMINGTAQADVGVLVISARKGEFETGFEKGGQTREHAQLAKTLGVAKLVVVVNKMDSVDWEQARFDEVVTKLSPFLKSCGYNVKKDVTFCPISGLTGAGIRDRVTKENAPWYGKESVFEVLDNMDAQDRPKDKPFRMPVLDKFRDMGTIIMGKSEAGIVRRGDNLVIMPNKTPIKVVTVYRDAEEVPHALPGENIRLRVTGVEEEELSTGFVVCDGEEYCKAGVTVVDAQLAITELLEHKSLFTAGYKAVMHVHTATEEVEVVRLLCQIDPKTKKPKQQKPAFVKQGSLVICRIKVAQSIALEKFEDYPQLGRFTLRDEGKTIAIGKIVGIPEKKKTGDAETA